MTTTVNVEHKRFAGLLHRLEPLAPMAISLIALAVSFVSLFLTELQPPRIRVHPAEFAYVQSHANNVDFHLYLAFTNEGAALGVVRKVAILLQPPTQSEGYLLQAAYFDELEQGNYAPESVVGPIPVDGRSTVSRQILFISARDQPGHRPLPVPGSYRATVLVWTSTDPLPTAAAVFPFVLSRRDLENMEAQRAGKSTITIELQNEQFQRWNARAINQQDVRDLLSGT